jgi:hypothetical protein
MNLACRQTGSLGGAQPASLSLGGPLVSWDDKIVN